MRVKFAAVVCILIDLNFLLPSSAQPSNTVLPTWSTATEETATRTCTALDPPVNEFVHLEKTQIILTFSTRQTDTYCIPLFVYVDCVALNEENVDGWQWIIKNTSANSVVDSANNRTSVHVTNLTEFTNYTCNVTLQDAQTSSPPIEVKFQTEGEVPGPPVNVAASKITGSSFVVQWEPPEKNPGIFVTYYIHIECNGPNHPLPWGCVPETYDLWHATTEEEFEFWDGFSDYTYEVTVLLENNAGNGTEVKINITTNTTASQAPVQFTLEKPILDIEADNLTQNVSWRLPCSINGKIEEYEIDLEGYYILNPNIKDVRTIHIPLLNMSQPAYNTEIELMPASNYSLGIRVNSVEVKGKFFNTTFSTQDNFPGKPILEISEIEANSFSASWRKPERRAGNITDYHVSITSLGPMYEVDPDRCIPDTDTYNETLDGTEMVYNFAKSRPYYKYEVSVFAVTSAGAGKPSTIMAETAPSVPDKPNNLTLTALDDNTTGLVTWKMPCDVNGPVTGFLIELTGNYSEDDFADVMKNETVSYKTNTYEYNHSISLNESYNYEIAVRLILENGTVGLSDSSYLSTPDGYPGPPSITNVTQATSNSFKISWNRPTTRNGRIMHYHVNVTSLGPSYNTSCNINDTINYNYEINGNNTIFTFNEGQPYFTYSIITVAKTSRGFGNASDSLNVTTKVSIPENVQNIEMQIQKPTEEVYNAKLNLWFDAPCRMNGPFLNYDVKLSGRSGNVLWKETFPLLANFMNDISLPPEFTLNLTIATKILQYGIVYSNRTSPKIFKSPAGVPQFSHALTDLKIKPKTTTATVLLDKKYLNETNGKIRYVSLILSQKNETIVSPFSEWDRESWVIVDRDGYYQLTENYWSPFKDEDVVTFTIGTETNCNTNYCNNPLESDTGYYLTIRIFTDNFYKDSPAIYFETEATSKLGVILGIIFGILLVAVLGLAAFFVWKRNFMRLPLATFNPRKSSTKSTCEGSTSFPINRFLQYYKSIESNPDKLVEQYALLTERAKELTTMQTTTFAELTENRRKNRYTNILPFDETRVKLLIDEDDEIGSDYINASYIKGYSGNIEYIATQGPLPSTCRDFWKMVIQENVTIIVMVTQFVEDNKEKCYKYFPNNHETMIVGDDIEVKCTMELHFGTYCVRTIQVKKDSTQVTVTHMQYLDWPDFNVPKGTDTMLQFCHKMRERVKMDGGYITVHCSAGVGRTGTLIATDILVQNINAGKNIDIFNTVLELRKQRMSMVQAQKQYVYIHNLIKDTLESHSSELMENLEPLYENQSSLQLKTDDDNLIDRDREKEMVLKLSPPASDES